VLLLFFAAANRGGGGGHRGSRGSSGRQQSSTLRFDGEFDFETSNAQFDKVQIEKEIEKELKEKLALGIASFEFRKNCYPINFISDFLGSDWHKLCLTKCSLAKL